MKRTIILTAAIVAAIASLAQVPSDSVGVFAITEGKTVRLEPLNFAGTKTNVLGTALTYGIASTKIKHIYNGATSPAKMTSPPAARKRRRISICSRRARTSGIFPTAGAAGRRRSRMSPISPIRSRVCWISIRPA